MFGTAAMPPSQIVSVINNWKQEDKTLDKQDNKHIPALQILKLPLLRINMGGRGSKRQG